MFALKKTAAALAFVVAAGLASTASAAPVRLGAAFARVQASYPTARPEREAGGRVLSLGAQDYAGLHWTEVDFVFDAGDHLSAVRLRTAGANMAAVQALVVQALSAPEPAQTLASEAVGDDMQFRVCESSETGVTLTLERPSVAL